MLLTRGNDAAPGQRAPDASVPAPFLSAGDPPPLGGESDELPFPVRSGCLVTPLVEAAEMYPALEQLVLDARRSVLLSFRIFSPTTRTRHPRSRERGLDDWIAVLRDAVMRGVTVRIMLADFEPVMAHDLHSLSWKSFQLLKAMAGGLPEARQADFQIMVVQHEGELGWGLRGLLRLPIRLRIQRLLDELARRGGDLGAMLEVRPGLWPHHRWDGERAVYRPGGLRHIWPATFHQKFAVIDDEVAVLGGLDVDERRWDDRRHDQPADRTWHDMSCRLEGPAVADAREHFRRLWNAQLPRFRRTAAEWMSGSDRKLILDPLHPIGDDAPGGVPAERGAARVQLLRTLSRRNASPLAFGPKPRVRELMTAHRLLIGSCAEMLYIETQFLRFRPAARWIVEQARRSPRLSVILVLPNAPEEVAFGKSRNPAHRHGEWLQVRALAQLRWHLGDRLGLFSLVKQEEVEPHEEQFTETRGTAFGSGVIHVHSKVLIADTHTALVSSANMNGRSFKWDTELGMMWQEPDGVRALRRKLWRQLLGTDDADDAAPGEALAVWRRIALANTKVPPDERQGFVVPHQIGRARRFSKPQWFVPDDLV